MAAEWETSIFCHKCIEEIKIAKSLEITTYEEKWKKPGAYHG